VAVAAGWLAASSAESLALDPSAPLRTELALDGLSFFAYAGSDKSAFLPSGATIPLEILRISDTHWRITIPANSFVFPPVEFPSGIRVEWRLTADAKGSCALGSGAAACVIDAPLEARPEGGGDSMRFRMRFSTLRAEAMSDGVVAARDGAPLDLGSGYLQLVAAGVSPTGAPTAPGKPFYAVLSGRIASLPQATTPK
jgi:hypothetical protein